MIRYNPPVPRIGFGVAAVVMAAVTFSLLVILPSELEEQGSTLALLSEPHRTAAKPAAFPALDLPCSVATAVNAPLFAGATATAIDQACKQPS